MNQDEKERLFGPFKAAFGQAKKDIIAMPKKIKEFEERTPQPVKNGFLFAFFVTIGWYVGKVFAKLVFGPFLPSGE